MNHSKNQYFDILSAKSEQDSELFFNLNSQRNSIHADQTNLTMNQKLSLSLSRISSSHNLSYNICDNSFSIIQGFKEFEQKEKSSQLQINLESNVLEIKDSEDLAQKIYESDDEITNAHINLNNCLIGDEGIKLISEALAKFQNITKINLSLQNNNISDQGLCYLWQAINKLINLKDLEIDLSYNEIQGSVSPASGLEGYVQLFKCCFATAAPSVNEILFTPQISRLSLNFEANHFDFKGIKNMSETLKICKNLNELTLNLRKNNLDCFSLIHLSEALGQKSVSSLHIDFGNNRVTCDDANLILYNISANASLENLTIDLQGSIRKECKASGLTINTSRSQDHIFNNLSCLELRFGWNNLSSENLSEILRKFKFCNKLTRINLDFCYNNFGDKGIFSLLQSISQCRMVRHLNLNLKKCQMSDKGLIEIGDNVELLKKLSSFTINSEFSNLTIDSIEYFNLNLQKCINIKSLSLNLQQSNLSDPKFEKIAKKMQRCHNSVELRVAFNIKPEHRIFDTKFKNSLCKIQSPLKV